MAFQFPLAKIDVINSALVQMGDNLVATADDGSDEWNVGSPAYERGLGYIIESHSWGFSTLVTVLQPSQTAPPDTDWDTAYPLPQDLVHLLWAKVDEVTSSTPGHNAPRLTTYSIESIGGVT